MFSATVIPCESSQSVAQVPLFEITTEKKLSLYIGNCFIQETHQFLSEKFYNRSKIKRRRKTKQCRLKSGLRNLTQ